MFPIEPIFVYALFGFDDAAGALLLATIVSGVVSAIGAGVSSATNYSNTKKTNEMNEELMRQGWARDDSSRVRLVNDLENAGLSKWLGTGASPTTSSPVSLQTPQMDNLGSIGDAMLHTVQNASSMKHTEKQNDILDKQGEVLDANEEVLRTENQIKQAELIKAQHDAEVFSSRPGVASTDPAPLKYLGEGTKFINGEGGLYNKIPQPLNPVKHYKWLKEKASSGVDWITSKFKSSKPINYNSWLKKNNRVRSEASSRDYDLYYNSFYK